jgi:hypothetical protein
MLSAAASGGCAVRRMATVSHLAPQIPHTDLGYRALLRNLRLLEGLRGAKQRFNVVITGIAAEDVANEMRKLESHIDFIVLGDSKTADFS